MPMAGYTKLFNSILASTIWEADMPTRIVWITMLAMADRHGVVEGSVPGLATFARVSLKDCQTALKALQAPDEHSRSKEHGGRRIEAIEGGWRLVNHAKYRAKLGDDERREYLRVKQAEYRRRNAAVDNVSQKSTVLTHAEAEAEASTEAEKIKIVPRASRSGFVYPEAFTALWTAYPRKTGKGDAAKVFARLKPSDADVKAMLAALEWQVKQPSWTKDHGQFIPHAATWLNQRRWEDEPFEPLPVDPRQLPAGKETAAQHTIRTGRETLDLLNEMEARERKAIR